jgi:hypothetical protein
MRYIGVEQWSQLKEVRNDVSHDYPVESDEVIDALNTLFELKPISENILHQCVTFLKEKGFNIT